MTHLLPQRLARFAALALFLFWIDLTSIWMIASQFALLTTDGCGQILDFSRRETYEIGFRLLRIILWSCLIAETVVPRLRAPAWSVFVLLTVGTLLIGSYSGSDLINPLVFGPVH
jgi:hypothetical protein